MKKEMIIKDFLNSGKTLVMPNAYDPISAKIIEHVGFNAVQCTGYGMSIELCKKSEFEIDLAKNLNMTKEIVNAVTIPVMADGEDGYGEGDCLGNVIKQFIDIGVVGINIEDQNHKLIHNGLKIIDENIMIDKLKTVIKTKKEKGKHNFIVNARTDAILSKTDRKEGLKIAIERANAYLEVGSDLCFIPYVKTYEEVKILSKEINGPISIAAGLPYNIKEFSINDCIELGVARVSLPSFLIFSSIEGMINNIKKIKQTGNFSEITKESSLLWDANMIKNILN